MKNIIKIDSKEQFEQLVKENKAVLVDFYADWCGPCKMIAPVLEELATDMPEALVLKVDVDVQQELAMEYQVMSIPTLISFKEGQKSNTVVGFQPKESLAALLK
jgi:thioredoxin 1